MKPTVRLKTDLCGTAGEYFVAAELSRLGYVASITLRNVRGIDILASNPDATQSVGIQVKTNQGSEKEWILSKKAENEIAENPLLHLRESEWRSNSGVSRRAT